MVDLLMNTKADTLLELKSMVTKSHIEDIFVVSAEQFNYAADAVCKDVIEYFEGDEIVVRSSSRKEDNIETSNAGHYKSILHVDSKDEAAIKCAIKEVFESYEDDSSTPEYLKLLDQDEKVLIQRQTKDVKLSGVLFTRDIIYNRPYYMITYDDHGSTDVVTSGHGGKTIWLAQNVSREFISDDFLQLIIAVREIQKIYEDITALDIEFAVKQDGTVVIFQVRPLVAALTKIAPMTDREFKDTKAFAKSTYLDTFHILSDMAYWNPAEIIGSNPRPLDYSLYRELVTAHIWNEGIVPLGYSKVDAELMQKVGNKPYISVNLTMEGLTPSTVSENLKYKLCEYYQEKLKKDKTAHDKIEFEIVFNAFDWSTDKELEDLLNHGFSKDEIKELRDALFDLTKNAVAKFGDIYDADMKALDQLTEFRRGLRNQGIMRETNAMKLYRAIVDLMESIKKYGTPQFTRQARMAFMARIFCRSLVQEGYFTQEEMDAFMLTISTVASEFERDCERCSSGEITREEFNSLYGHLRLGTYDIRSDSYKNSNFDLSRNAVGRRQRSGREAKMLDEARLEKAIKDFGIFESTKQFVDFVTRSTQNREYFKFEFTKTLSLILDVIIRIGNLMGIDREDMSYLEVQDLTEYHSRDTYIPIIEYRRNMYHAYTYLMLPEVIFNVGDIDVIDLDDARPNFITNKTIEAEVVNLDEGMDQDITGKIVIVTKADPGYDWVFVKDIAGFMTKYGGAASHMAIRCAEFGIPAAIGCGEKIYQKVLGMKKLRLDCSTGRITEI